MEDDAKLRQAWIDWINAQYTLADRLLTPSLVGSPLGDGGGALSELPLALQNSWIEEERAQRTPRPNHVNATDFFSARHAHSKFSAYAHEEKWAGDADFSRFEFVYAAAH